MGYKQEFIKRAFDANAFISTDAYATVVNPNIWDRQLRDYEEANLIFANHAQLFDFRSPGVDYTVTVDAAPTAAAAVAETDAVAIQPITNRQVTFTPTEYGSAIEFSRKEMVRAFFQIMGNASKKLGYALALKKDALGITSAQTNAGNAVTVNDVVSSDIASSDTLSYAAIVKGSRLIEDDYYTPTKLFVNPTGKQQLLDLTTVHKANEFGTRDAVEKGLIGELFGLKIFVTHGIAVASNQCKAIILGESRTGEQAMGLAVKRDPMIEQDYDPLFRKFLLVAHEEYQWQVLHPNAICTVEHYA